MCAESHISGLISVSAISFSPKLFHISVYFHCIVCHFFACMWIECFPSAAVRTPFVCSFISVYLAHVWKQSVYGSFIEFMIENVLFFSLTVHKMVVRGFWNPNWLHVPYFDAMFFHDISTETKTTHSLIHPHTDKYI